MINTSASPVEIGKNVRIGDWKPLDGVCAGSNSDFDISDVEDSEESREQNKVYTVSKEDDRSSAPPELTKVINRKLEHLVKSEREVLGPVMLDYCDLFLFDRSGTLPCTGKGFHEIKTGDALPIKKNPYKAPFALRSEIKKAIR
jgi:hypothetical protein